MPYFIDLERRQVVVMPPGATPVAGQSLVDANTATATDLRHGQVLTEAQVSALLSASPDAFRAATAQATGTRQTPGPSGAAATGPRRPKSTAARANAVAGLVEGFAWAFLVLSVVGGLVVALQTRLGEFGTNEHPYVGSGLLIAVAGSFQALVVIMFATYIKWRTEER